MTSTPETSTQPNFGLTNNAVQITRTDWPKPIIKLLDNYAKTTAINYCKWRQLNLKIDSLKDSQINGTPCQYLQHSLKIYKDIKDPDELASIINIIATREIQITTAKILEVKNNIDNYMTTTNQAMNPILLDSGIQLNLREVKDYIDHKIAELRITFTLKQIEDQRKKAEKAAKFQLLKEQEAIKAANFTPKDMLALNRKFQTMQTEISKLKNKQSSTKPKGNGKGKQKKSHSASRKESTGTGKGKNTKPKSTSRKQKSHGKHGKSSA